MGIDGFMLILGGIAFVAIGFGFYKFIQYQKKNRETNNQLAKDEVNKIVSNVKNTIEDLKNKF